MTDAGAEVESLKYLAVCVPIVVFFAPFGSFVSSHFHRKVLASLIYILDTVALVITFPADIVNIGTSLTRQN
jgi:hypothetical protein